MRCEDLNRPSIPFCMLEEDYITENQVVYFIQIQPPIGPIKIGITSNIKSRLSHLQTACPYKLEILNLIEMI